MTPRPSLLSVRVLRRRLWRFLSKISIRLLAFNLLLVFLPFFVFFSLPTFEGQLLDMQERSMVQQGRLLAAALGSQPELDPEEVQRILVNMRREFDARLRVVDRAYNVVADSSRQGPRRDGEQPTAAESTVRLDPIYRLGSFLYRSFERFFSSPPAEPVTAELVAESESGRLTGREVKRALDGAYGRSMRSSPSGQRSLTMNSALPIRWDGEVIGAVVVSKSTAQVLRSVQELRLNAFKVVLASIGAAIILSLLVATTINRPLSRLRQEAQAILDRRGRLRGGFTVSKRQDEIGDLSRALAELTRRLEGHLQFIESFASDVSHELKNPLAAIRNANDLLSEVEESEARQRFSGMIRSEIARLEQLLAGVREISRLDARANERPFEAIELSGLLRTLLDRLSLVESPRVELLLQYSGPVEVMARPERLVQVFENLITNAVSFSPPGGHVLVDMTLRDDRVLIEISDQGPGIPPEHLERIFERFFSYRPGESKAGSAHTGLGLAIVKAIVENHGGRVWAELREDGPGAILGVELPLIGVHADLGTQRLTRIED